MGEGSGISVRMARRIELWPLSELRAYAVEAPEAAHVEQVCASVAEFGFNSPVLLDRESGIVAGHGLVLAAERLGLEEVPVVVLNGLSDAQRRAYILASAKLEGLTGWGEVPDVGELVGEGLEVEFDLDLESERVEFDADDLGLVGD